MLDHVMYCLAQICGLWNYITCKESASHLLKKMVFKPNKTKKQKKTSLEALQASTAGIGPLRADEFLPKSLTCLDLHI